MGKNAATNRLVFQPKREVATPAFTYNARISDAGRAELDNGGSAFVEGCHYRNSDNHFSGKIHYDIHRGEYVTTPLRYERPYIPESIRKQITEEQQQALSLRKHRRRQHQVPQRQVVQGLHAANQPRDERADV